jgi:hypothetical protein
MTTIDTTTTTSGLAFCNGRHIARTSTGRIWVGFGGAATQFEFWYSDDDGATFTQNASATVSASVNNGFSFFIDVDDHAHLAYRTGSGGFDMSYRRMANIGTATSWGSAFGISGTYYYSPDIVAFRDGASWNAAIAASDGANIAVYILTDVDSSPTISQSLSYGANGYPSLDFHHTGDGKTISGASPHLYAASTSGSDLYYRKFTYLGGTYTTGTRRTLDSGGTKSTPVSLAFDGTRVLIAFAESNYVGFVQRDEADTTTTTASYFTSDGDITNLSISYDGSGDAHLWFVGTTTDDLNRLTYDRSANQTALSVVYTGNVAANSLTLKRGYSDSAIEAVFLDGASSPYNVKYASLSLVIPASFVRIAVGTQAKVRDAAGTAPFVRLADGLRL